MVSLRRHIIINKYIIGRNEKASTAQRDKMPTIYWCYHIYSIDEIDVKYTKRVN